MHNSGAFVSRECPPPSFRGAPLSWREPGIHNHHCRFLNMTGYTSPYANSVVMDSGPAPSGAFPE
jgi:hypothetical protein